MGDSDGRLVRGLIWGVGLVSFVSSWFTSDGRHVPDDEDSMSRRSRGLLWSEGCCRRIRGWRIDGGLRIHELTLTARCWRGFAAPFLFASGWVVGEARAGLLTVRTFASCADFVWREFHVVDIRLGGASRLHWLRPEAVLGRFGCPLVNRRGVRQ